jgi:hypothetical protein
MFNRCAFLACGLHPYYCMMRNTQTKGSKLVAGIILALALAISGNGALDRSRENSSKANDSVQTLDN